ncbi:MAG: peptidylprolyl isomerase [Gallionella sp.]|nr:peptidylprolyl isomerase [Gallionella sp.]
MSNRYSINKFDNSKLTLMVLLGGVMLSTTAFAADTNPQASAPANTMASADLPVFARVGKNIITWREYDATFTSMNRGKFYHGKPPEAEIAAMQREVGNKLIANALLLHEAERRKLKPDAAAVDKKIEQHEQRYANDAQWQEARVQVLPLLTKQWQEESLLNKLEKLVRDVPPPKEAQVRQYYTAHPDKFTEPEQLRVSIIMLKVDPSSPSEVWGQALAEGLDLVAQIRAGGDFEELARDRSDDANSAERGGDMGYLHGGMLSEAAQEAVDKLQPGETSEPIRVLEGIVIVRLTDRKLPKLSSYETVRERARELWLREEGERVWQLLIERLKKETPIVVDESRYLPLPGVAGGTVVPKVQ